MAQVFFYGKPDQDAGTYRFNLPVLNNLRTLGVQHLELTSGIVYAWG